MSQIEKHSFKSLIRLYKENSIAYTYAFFSVAFVIGLATGEIIMSVATFGLVINWLIEGNFKQKIQLAKERKYIPLVLIIGYLSLVFWLLNTTDFAYAFRDLKIKLPLLFFPLVLGTITFSQKLILTIYRFFVLGVLFSSFVSLLVYLAVIPIKNDLADVRNVSIFISHIRLSLLVCFAIVLLAYFWTKATPLFNRYLSVLMGSWLIYFLFLLQAFTGVFILIVLIASALVFFLVKKGNGLIKLIFVVGFVSVLIFSFMHVSTLYKNNFKTDKIQLNSLAVRSASGEVYQHRLEDNWLENGNRVWLYIAPLELEEAWNNVSSFPFDSLDLKGQPMWGTLYRFLSSKGYRKDKDGLAKLTPEEIQRIENGTTNCCEQLTGFDSRIKEIIFEYERYKNQQDPNGHSFVQRVIYLKAASALIQDNFYTGVGIGDVHDEFMNYYEENNSSLKGSNRKRVHNQFMSLTVALGIGGLLLWLIVFYYPFFALPENRQLYFYFLLIITISFLTDNTLERQAGVMFFAFFNSLLLFHKVKE